MVELADPTPPTITNYGTYGTPKHHLSHREQRSPRHPPSNSRYESLTEPTTKTAVTHNNSSVCSAPPGCPCRGDWTVWRRWIHYRRCSPKPWVCCLRSSVRSIRCGRLETHLFFFFAMLPLDFFFSPPPSLQFTLPSIYPA